MDACTGGGAVREEGDGAAAVDISISSKDHALADILTLHHRAGCQVGHDADLFADQILGCEPLGDAGQDAALTLAVKDGQVE